MIQSRATLSGIERWFRARAAVLVGVLLVTLLLTLVILAVFVLPALFVTPDEVPDVVARLKVQNDVRTTLVQAVGGLVLLVGASLTWRTIQVNWEGQITERFTRAIEQLGSEKLDVRLGGIYALERIAKNSRADHGPIMEVLTAFVRERITRKDNTEPAPSEGGHGSQPNRLPADVEAVVAVLRRRKIHHEDPGFRLDLSGAHLPGANLKGATLQGALLDGANLQHAWLTRANLQEASLIGADLYGAFLDGANLQRAWLEEGATDRKKVDLRFATLFMADLRGASLAGANLQRATLARAKLEGTYLGGTDLQGASLEGASMGAGLTFFGELKPTNLEGANLTGADLKGVDLSEVKGAIRESLAAAKNVVFPPDSLELRGEGGCGAGSSRTQRGA